MKTIVAASEREPLFLTTHWSLVVSAADDSAASLETLCQQYWQPIYAVARKQGHDIEAAKDLTQSFFGKLLEKGWLESADESKGRFRTFLVTALKRYLINEWHRENTIKRGRGIHFSEFDTVAAERLAPCERDLSPERLFDRRWALTLLDIALARLKEESGDDFELLKDSLTAGRGEIDYAALAQSLATTEGAARVVVHRLRKQYRAVIRAEIAQTCATDSEVDDELRILMEALI